MKLNVESTISHRKQEQIIYCNCFSRILTEFTGVSDFLLSFSIILLVLHRAQLSGKTLVPAGPLVFRFSCQQTKYFSEQCEKLVASEKNLSHWEPQQSQCQALRH